MLEIRQLGLPRSGEGLLQAGGLTADRYSSGIMPQLQRRDVQFYPDWNPFIGKDKALDQLEDKDKIRWLQFYNHCKDNGLSTEEAFN